MNHADPEIPPPVREILERLNQAVFEDADLRGNIVNTLERYLSDSLWPSNFRELEKALDRLTPGLSRMLRTCLISNVELFDPWREQLPDKLVGFLKDLQEHYSYRYRVGVYRTVLSSDGYGWYTVHVQEFRKNNNPWYGISIVRNDGEQIYFDGSEDSISHMIAVIQGVMQKEEKTRPEEAEEEV